MGLNDRVLWEEGMFLGPQHFQQAERHLLHQLHGRFAAALPRSHGWTRLVVDEEALAGGEFALRQLGGVLRDGTVVDAPDLDRLPAPRPLKDVFAARQAGLIASVGVATARIGVMVVRDGGAPGRYRRALSAVLDDEKGALERDVAIGELDLRVCFEGESADGLQLLPVARITRGAGAQLALDAAFVPPLLFVGACPRLLATVRRLLEFVTSKTDELTRKRGQQIGGRAQFSTVEAASFWLLHTLNSWLPLLAHHHQEPRQHPEVLYRDLAALVGALSTFAGSGRVAVPAYDHAAPGPVFDQLEKLVFDLSQLSAPETCEPILLRPKGAGEYAGQILDESLFERAEFYLAFSADVSADEVIRELPVAAKLGSPEGVALARTRALRGVRLTHLPTPPSEIPQRAGFHYFVVSRDDPQWQQVQQARTVELYVPPKFKEPTVELFAVRKAQS